MLSATTGENFVKSFDLKSLGLKTRVAWANQALGWLQELNQIAKGEQLAYNRKGKSTEAMYGPQCSRLLVT